ncbi:TPA: MipA/OmpV family protein [Serratia fonticola]
MSTQLPQRTQRTPLTTSTLALIVSSISILIPLTGHTQSHDPADPISLFGDRAEVTLGFGAAYIPRYLGAKHASLIPVPTISVYRGIFFIDTVRGAGVEYQASNGFYGSLALGYDPGRAEKNSDWRPGSKRLQGMGEVKGATTANLLLAQPLTSWLSLNGEAELRLAGHQRGNRYRLGLESPLLQTTISEITFGANVHAGDGRFNRTYFGVNEAQAQTSRFSHFDAGSGVYAYSLSVDWHIDFDEHWTASLGGNVMRFSEKAHSSPVAERKTGVSGFTTLHYAF